MKKIILFLTTAVLLQAGFAFAQEAEFYDDGGAYPFQIGLYPTLQFVPYDQDVTGLRINVIGVNRNMTGVDVGLINQSDESFRGIGLGLANLSKGEYNGIGIGIVNHVNGDSVGIFGVPLLSWYQAINVVHGELTGMQGGWYNQAGGLNGLQGGAVNVSDATQGGQLGIYNYAGSMGGVQLGLVNMAYKDAHGLQIGIFNGAGHFRGLQIALVNQAQTLEGLQIGIVNAVSQKDTLPVMVIANWQF